MVSNDFLFSLTNLFKHLFLKWVISQKCLIIANLSAIDNDNWYAWFVLFVNGYLGYFSYYLHAINNLSKYNMLAIKMWTCFQSDEKLWRVGVPATIRHWQQPRTWMSPWEVFVNKCPSIDREPTLTTSVGYVTTLNNKTINNTVKLCIQIM